MTEEFQDVNKAYLYLGIAILDTPAILGIGLIAAGVVVINLFSKSAAH